ncbi:MAG: hypothetical protein U9Q82_00280 [Chloroflexota bacterium]|nr:hypothetical protein [Chloroflexota bacterium]
MATHFNHKGKFFTDVISKDVVRVTVQTLTVRIVGDIHVRPDERLKDELNKDDWFIAMTDAVVYNARGQEIYRSEFLAINQENIVWISPEYDIDAEQDEG